MSSADRRREPGIFDSHRRGHFHDSDHHLNNAVELPAIGYGVFQRPPDETVVAVEAAPLAVGRRFAKDDEVCRQP